MAASSYQLSSEILGHTGDVRAVTCFQAYEADYIVTGSRDRSACIWKRDGNDYLLHKHITLHTGYVSSLCIMSDEDTALVVTGSQDKSILVHSIDPTVSEPVATYIGHKDLVSCLIYQDSCVISGSWDRYIYNVTDLFNCPHYSTINSINNSFTIRVWDAPCIVLKAHEPAVWTLAGLHDFDGTNRILSGGADKMIKLWDISTSSCIQEYCGHSDVVRDVKVLSAEVFISASNDCTICRWNIHTGQRLNELYGHQAFVYNLSLMCTGNGFVSCGEDSTMKVWKDTECVQTISLPCISVWCVGCSSSGDIVVGSSDSVARVFTMDPSRIASPQHIQTFLSNVEEFQNSRNKKSIDVSSLPKMSVALSEPGQKTGDTKLVNNNGKAEVYQWNSESVEWIKIGDALGQAPDNNREYNGKEYDYLFDIEIDDETSPTMRKLKLPYNKTEDPFVAAERFLSANDIPSWYLDQVANFIMENAEVHYVSPGIHDPFTGGARYVPGTTSNVGNDGLNDPFTGGSRYNPGGTSSTNQPINVSFASKSSNAVSSNPHYPITSYQTFTSPVDYVTKIMGKFKEFCQTYPDECVASDEDISAIEAMCISLVNSKPPNQHHIPLLLKLLDWPPQYIFPVLDIIRLAILDPSCAQMLFDLTDYSQRLFQLSCHPDADSKNQLLVLKILVNSFVHGETWFQSQLLVIFDIVGKLSDIQLSKSHQIALSVLFINLSCYYCKFGIDKITEMIKFHIRILNSPLVDNEAKYRVLVAIGTLMSSKGKLDEEVSITLRESLAMLLDVSDPPKVSDCASYILETII